MTRPNEATAIHAAAAANDTEGFDFAVLPPVMSNQAGPWPDRKETHR